MGLMSLRIILRRRVRKCKEEERGRETNVIWHSEVKMTEECPVAELGPICEGEESGPAITCFQTERTHEEELRIRSLAANLRSGDEKGTHEVWKVADAGPLEHANAGRLEAVEEGLALAVVDLEGEEDCAGESIVSHDPPCDDEERLTVLDFESLR